MIPQLHIPHIYIYIYVEVIQYIYVYIYIYINMYIYICIHNMYILCDNACIYIYIHTYTMYILCIYIYIYVYIYIYMSLFPTHLELIPQLRKGRIWFSSHPATRNSYGLMICRQCHNKKPR